MDALARLVAKEAIRELAHRYAVAVDARDLDALVALFDPEVRVGRDATGREALRRDFERSLGAIGVSILFVGNHVIDFDAADAARARGIVYCAAQVQDGERWIEQAIRYDDDYVLRDGAWLFARRRHRLFYGLVAAQNPLRQPPAEWPKRHAGRGTLPEELPSWQAFWERRGS
jgi:hypothetical protein